MEGIAKVIDELGSLIIAKDVEIRSKQEEIDKLKRKIEYVECYIDALESYTNANKRGTLTV